jgi:hypothetical protein
MGTKAQNEANRRNAHASKGPITEEGKVASARNAVRHGLLSEEPLVLGEDAEAFKAWHDEIWAEMNPAGAIESMHVARIISLSWRLRRVSKIEAGIVTYERQESLSGDGLLHELRSAIGYDEPRSTSGQQQQTELAKFGQAFLRGYQNDGLTKLSRYETSLQRNLSRTLHEVQRLQAARQGKNVLVPVAIDIDVSGSEHRELDVDALDYRSET